MTITLTDSFVKQMNRLREQENEPELMLRVTVTSGGCNGFEYHFSEETEMKDDDEVFDQDGVRVVIDSMSFGFLIGSEIDYVDDLIGSYFKINNPNAASSCGCGTSFSV